MDAITRTLSAYAVELSHADLTEQAVHGMRQRLVDSVACALGGVRQRARALSHASWPGRRRASRQRASCCRAMPASPEMAAFANTVMVRYLDFNDTYFASAGGHPSDTVGGVVAVAGAWGLSGRDAMLGMVTAYEIFCVLGEVEARVGQPTRAAIATAAATGKMVGLDQRGRRTRHLAGADDESGAGRRSGRRRRRGPTEHVEGGRAGKRGARRRVRREACGAGHARTGGPVRGKERAGRVGPPPARRTRGGVPHRPHEHQVLPGPVQLAGGDLRGPRAPGGAGRGAGRTHGHFHVPARVPLDRRQPRSGTS